MTGSTDKPRRSRASKGSRGRWFLLLVISLAMLILVPTIVVVYVFSTTARSVSNIVRVPDALPTGSRPPVPTPSVRTTNSPVNLLLIGSDKRSGSENGRSDSFVVLHISADRKSAYLVSFPRDMWVAIPGHGIAKINAAYSWGGSALAVQTLEQLTGARIDHVATTDFSRFVGLVDIVGGVTVDNPVASKAKNLTGGFYDWPKGPVLLDGPAALAFSRQRYELPNGDLDRALRQRALLKALALKVATPEVLANPARLSRVISTVSQYVTLDSQMTNQAILDLATSMRITNSNQITMLQAPLKGFGRSADGQDYDVVDVPGVAALGKALQDDTMAAYVAAHPPA